MIPDGRKILVFLTFAKWKPINYSKECNKSKQVMGVFHHLFFAGIVYNRDKPIVMNIRLISYSGPEEVFPVEG